MQHPDHLGKYTITALLGEGAMGVVYKGFDPGIGRPVAIKTIRKALSPSGSDEGSMIDRFRNEARAVGRMNHPGIVAIYELGQDDDNVFIAMEYVEGRDLSQILVGSLALPEPDVLLVMNQLLDALDYAHKQGVWHRDIKPANLIITTEGRLKVTDFGIARIESAALTLVTSTIGTPGYMAPEQYIGEAFDHRVDIFAAGVLLYRMLSGKLPFTGSAEAIMYNIMNKDPPPLGPSVPMDVAAFYEPVLALALARNPTQRFANAAAFREALQTHNAGDLNSTGETTIVVQAARGQGERLILNQDPRRSTMGESIHQIIVDGWELAVLAAVQDALARFMGPMAKVMVRQAARKCNDMQSLIALISKDIPNPGEQTKFVALMQRYADTGALGSSVNSKRATDFRLAGHQQQVLSTQLIDSANLIMTRYIGPIAKIVVKNAAAQATTPEQFVEMLAEKIPVGSQRTQLVDDFQSAVVAQRTSR